MANSWLPDGAGFWRFLIAGVGLRLYGAVSGWISFVAAAASDNTPYTLPATKPAISGAVATATTSGVISWQPLPTLPQLAPVGGCPINDLQTTVNTLSGGAPGAGRTLILGGPNYQIRQAGYIRRVVVGIPAGNTAGANLMKIKVVRPNTPTSPATTTWTVLGQYLVPSIPNGLISFVVDLPTPIACLPGDYLALWLAGISDNSVRVTCDTTKTDGTVYFGSVDLQTGGTLSSQVTGIMGVTGFDIQPFFVECGDSIPAGHGAPNPSFTFRDAIAGTFTTTFQQPTNKEFAFLLRSNLGAGWRYQNLALGGSTLADVVANQISQAVALCPRFIHVHSAVNDIAGGQTNAQMLANMDLIRKAVPQTTPLFVDEVLPWATSSSGNATNAAATRSWNAALATWCAANNATLILCHDKMGVVWGTTGQIDQLKPTFDSGDGIHPNNAGAVEMDTLIQSYVDAQFAVPQTIDGITATVGDVQMTGPGIAVATITAIQGVSIGTPTGTGNVVLSNSPILVAPALGTPVSGNLANCSINSQNLQSYIVAMGVAL